MMKKYLKVWYSKIGLKSGYARLGGAENGMEITDFKFLYRPGCRRLVKMTPVFITGAIIDPIY